MPGATVGGPLPSGAAMISIPSWVASPASGVPISRSTVAAAPIARSVAAMRSASACSTLRLMTLGMPENMSSATRTGSPVTLTNSRLTTAESAPPSVRPCITTR
jgi:hypothetical protein